MYKTTVAFPSSGNLMGRFKTILHSFSLSLLPTTCISTEIPWTGIHRLLKRDSCQHSYDFLLFFAYLDQELMDVFNPADEEELGCMRGEPSRP